MSEMVERVARAIAEGLGDDFDHAFESKSEWVTARGDKGGRYRDVNEPRQGDYLDAARSAIEAMLFPTPAMCSAVRRAAWFSGSGQDPANVIRAAVSAALEP